MKTFYKINRHIINLHEVVDVYHYKHGSVYRIVIRFKNQTEATLDFENEAEMQTSFTILYYALEQIGY